MKNLTNRSDMRVLGGLGNNYSKIILVTLEPTKIKSRETSKKGLRVAKTTSNQSVCSQKSSITCETPSESLKYAHATPILQKLHWLPVKYRCIFKTTTLVYKFLHSGSPSYFEPFLSFSSCPYSTRHSHPDRQYLTVPPFH